MASTTASAPTAKYVAENIAKHIAKVCAACTRLTVNARMTILVIAGAFVFVGQHFEGLIGLLENVFRIGVIWVSVGMILHRDAAIGLFQSGRVGSPLYIQHLIVVTF